MSDILSAEQQDMIYQLAVAPSGWYAACASGLRRSVDQGRSWQPAYASLGADEPLATFAVVTAQGAADEPFVIAGLSGELLRSTNGGATWSVMSRPNPAPVITTLVASPAFAEDGRLFAGTLEDGVILYSANGDQWAMWNFGLMDNCVLSMVISPAFRSDQTIFIGMESGMFRSVTGGRSWEELTLPCGYASVLSLAISAQFAQDATIYAGTDSGGLFVSTDGGAHWEQRGAEVLSEPINSIICDGARLLVLHGGALLTSADGGHTWDTRPDDQEITALFAPDGLQPGAPLLLGCADGTIRYI